MRPPFLQAPYAMAFYVACGIWYVPELIDEIRRERTSGDTDSDADFDRGSKYAIYAGIAITILAGFAYPHLVPSLNFGELFVPLFWSEIALVPVGVAVRWYAVFVLGQFFSREVTVTADQALVDTGPYAYVRHPTYTGGLITMIGIGFAFGNWLSLATAAIVGFVTYGYRIRIEEAALRAALDGYDDYCDRTAYRLVPFIY